LLQNYPNPFNSATTIKYRLPREARVILAIYNSLGQRVRVLVGGRMIGPGNYRIQWDGKDDRSRDVVSGIYLCRLQAGGFVLSRKIVVMR
jgi:hypothetical protein